MTQPERPYQNPFDVSRETSGLLEGYVSLLTFWQRKINLVSRETLEHVWERHIWDSAQLSRHIKDKEASVLDLGTGAGLPGVVLSIMGYKKVTLVDSNSKKTTFLKEVKRKLSLNFEVLEGRIENQTLSPVDVIVSRALASLDDLLLYSERFLKPDSQLVFLKGKVADSEIEKAKKSWVFQFEKKQSITSTEGCVLILSGVQKKR